MSFVIMVYCPTMAIPQPLDMIFPSSCIDFSVEEFCVSIAQFDGR
jgi:hypothetical protein